MNLNQLFETDALNEEVRITPSAKALGVRHIGLVEKTKNTMEPVVFDFGTQQFRVTAPKDKKWFLDTWAGYRRSGQEDRFLEMMGTLPGFERILDQFAAYHSRNQAAQKKIPKNRGGFEESLSEADQARTPGVEHLLTKLHKQFPQARSDMEALVYNMADTQKKSRQEIDALQKHADDLEKDVKQELQQTIGQLGKTRGRVSPSLQQVKATTDKQQQIINRIIQIDQQQQKELDALGSTVGSTPSSIGNGPVSDIAPSTTAPADISAPVSVPTTPVAAPAPAIDPSITRQTKQADATRAARDQMSKNVAPEPTAAPEPIDIGSVKGPMDNVRPFKKKAQRSLFPNEPGPKKPADDISKLKVAEGALKDQSLSALLQAKQAIEQQRAAEIEAWRQDFEKNTAQRAGQQLKRAFEPAPVAKPGEKHSVLKSRLANLNAAIQKQQYLDMLVGKAEKLGVMNPGLKADADTSLYVRDGARDDYVTLNQRLDTAIQRIKDRISVRKVSGLGEEKPGLWANIHAKRERIKHGSGERMRKPGSKGAPSPQNFKDAAKTSKNEGISDDPWGNRGNFAGSTPVNLGGATVKQLGVGDTVSYLGRKAKILAQSKDRKYSRITILSDFGGTTKDVLTSDLKRTGLKEADGQKEFILYVNGKPAAKYLDQMQAEKDIAAVKRKHPQAQLELKHEVCNLQTLKKVNEGESILSEFAPPGGDSNEPDEEHILRQLAAQWWHGDEDPRAEKALAAMGWEIGHDESGDPDAGVFVVRAGDVNGDSYIAFPESALTLDEGITRRDLLKGVGAAALGGRAMAQGNDATPLMKGVAYLQGFNWRKDATLRNILMQELGIQDLKRIDDIAKKNADSWKNFKTSSEYTASWEEGKRDREIMSDVAKQQEVIGKVKNIVKTIAGRSVSETTAGPVEAWGYVYNRRDQREVWRRNFHSEQAAHAWADRMNATVLGIKPLQQPVKEAGMRSRGVKIARSGTNEMPVL